MSESLKLGIAGLGTVGTGLLQLLRGAWAPAGAKSSAARSRWRASRRARATRSAASPLEGLKWFDDAERLAADPAIDVFVELIGGDEGTPRRAVEAALEGRQARRHRQQGAARPARHRACRARREERRGAELRGGGGRRHPRHQDAARGAGRQPDPPRLRHPQRHLQLHPDADAGGAPLLRRRARRRRRPRATPRPIPPSTSTASTPPTSWPCSPAWPSAPASPSTRSTSRASAPSPRPTSRRPTTSATASSCWAWR